MKSEAEIKEKLAYHRGRLEALRQAGVQVAKDAPAKADAMAWVDALVWVLAETKKEG